MTTVRSLATLATIAQTAAGAHAQFVKGNEAVTHLPNGGVSVETPPLPKATLGRPCPALDPTCTATGWLMVETKEGIRECTEFYARPGTCRASTFGAEKRPRLWIIKSKGQWLQCERPSLESTCVSTKQLPNTVIQ